MKKSESKSKSSNGIGGFKLKRGIWVGILLYVSTFIVGLIIGGVVGVDFSDSSKITYGLWIFTLVITIVLTGLFSLWYFAKARASSKNGLMLGITFLIVGIVLDSLFLTTYVLTGGDASVALAYYQTIWFYITVTLMVLTAFAVGHFKK